MKHNTNKIGIYVRESRDDFGENYETIEVQRDLLVDYVKKNNLGEIKSIYIDDNVSGAGFERNGIDELKNDIRNAKIDLLILKDLSRLGRNNAKTLLFLDYLEEYGIRVITFDGRYDSLKDNETVGIDTWFNERYIRDISKKIRTNIRYKIERGEYIGSAPYGYKKSEAKKNTLVVDESTAQTVKEIFELYLNGHGQKSIAEHLNETGILSPLSIKNNGKTLWSAVAINRILSNRVYIGDTVQGISEKITFKSKKTRRLPRENWIITENTHQAIIDRNVFEEAQKIRQSKKNNILFPNKGKTHPFRGIVHCGKCGSSMFARSRKNGKVGFVCGNYCKNGAKECTSHYINQQILINIVSEEIKELFGIPKWQKEIEIFFESQMNTKKQKLGDIKTLQSQLLSKQKQQETLYMDKLDGKVSEELFKRINENIEKDLLKINNQIDYIHTISNYELNIKENMAKLLEDLKTLDLTNGVVDSIIESIIVYEPDDADKIEQISNKQKLDIAKYGGIILHLKIY